MPVMKVYFAHPMALYNTDYAKRCLDYIAKRFGPCTIVNPSEPKYAAAYMKKGGKGMDYWKKLAKSCDVLVATPFRDGEHGAGVWAEMEAAHSKGTVVYQLHQGRFRPIDFRDVRPLSISETSLRTKRARGLA